MSKILIIDDSLLMRKISRDVLEEGGHVVDECLPDTVAELMERIQETEPDLVLSDFNMPHIDGLNVARTVKRTRPDLPVIILTANRDPAREALLHTIGVRIILHKPLAGPDLIQAVDKLLKAP